MIEVAALSFIASAIWSYSCAVSYGDTMCPDFGSPEYPKWVESEGERRKRRKKADDARFEAFLKERT